MKSSLLLGPQVSRGPGDTHAWCGPLRVGSLPRKVKHTLRLETQGVGSGLVRGGADRCPFLSGDLGSVVTERSPRQPPAHPLL